MMCSPCVGREWKNTARSYPLKKMKYHGVGFQKIQETTQLLELMTIHSQQQEA